MEFYSSNEDALKRYQATRPSAKKLLQHLSKREGIDGVPFKALPALLVTLRAMCANLGTFRLLLQEDFGKTVNDVRGAHTCRSCVDGNRARECS